MISSARFSMLCFCRAMLRTARWCHSKSSVCPSVCDV